jgi:hypothetical protein
VAQIAFSALLFLLDKQRQHDEPSGQKVASFFPVTIRPRALNIVFIPMTAVRHESGKLILYAEKIIVRFSFACKWITAR